jgi:hypothetical protein
MSNPPSIVIVQGEQHLSVVTEGQGTMGNATLSVYIDYDWISDRSVEV